MRIFARLREWLRRWLGVPSDAGSRLVGVDAMLDDSAQRIVRHAIAISDLQKQLEDLRRIVAQQGDEQKRKPIVARNMNQVRSLLRSEDDAA